MAVGAKKTVGGGSSAKSQAPRGAVASMRPDQFTSGGLPDDFDGVITNARLVPWNYGKADQQHVLAARVTIQPDEDSGLSEEVVQHYSAGDLEHFVPSMDGENPVDLDAHDDENTEATEGVYALRVGKREGLSNSSNWGHFLTALGEAGFSLEDMDPNIQFLEGVYGHFNRVPQRKRSGALAAQQGDKVREILVCTEFKERRDLSAASKPAAASKGAAKGAAKAGAAKATSAAAAADNGAGSIDEQLTAALLEALSGAPDNTLTKAKLPTVAIKAFAGGQKSAAVARVTKPDFLETLSESGMFWDADEGTLTLVTE